MQKSDSHLKRDIETELRCDPKVNSARIGVTVDDGNVTLFGTVDTYPEKWAAEDATKRISGVRRVAQDLAVEVLADHERTDAEIAVAVDHTLNWDVRTPSSVTAKVQNGVVKLEGQVKWNYEREGALNAVRSLTGVTAVSNAITLEPTTSAAQLKQTIEAALQRQASKDSKSIHIAVAGGKVSLTGQASSWQSIDDAANAAWAVPGVTEVVDQLTMQQSIERFAQR